VQNNALWKIAKQMIQLKPYAVFMDGSKIIHQHKRKKDKNRIRLFNTVAY
jgi:type IV secretory pathway VirB9-like protein